MPLLKRISYPLKPRNCTRSLILIIFFFVGSISFGQNVIWVNQTTGPFYILSDTTINSNDSLMIGNGGLVYIGDGVNVDVFGTLEIIGSDNNPALIHPINAGIGWGQIIIHDSVDSLNVKNAEIIDGRIYATDCIITYESTKFMNQQDLEWNGALSRFFGGQLRVNNCTFKGINQGEGLLCHGISNPIITNCQFDSIPDAVEFLNCNLGRIGNCTFQNCYDDAIDLNHCQQTLIDSNYFYNIFNRGMEIGSENNGSSTDILVYRNILVNCAEAVTFKEGSTGLLENNTFFNNDIGVSALVLGDPAIGSSVEVINCIFQNNAQDLFTDASSQVNVTYSSSNNQPFLGIGNIFGQAKLISPSASNFNLNLASACINSGSPFSPFDLDGSRADMGALFQPLQGALQPIRLWPNPATSYLKIHLLESFDALQITDHLGRICAQLNIRETKYIVYPIAHLTPGIYYAQFTRADDRRLLKFVVE
jgi:hypothetical protein